MTTLRADAVTPGMTIKTEATASCPPVTLTVADGFFCDADYGDPTDDPTHVSLADADGNDVLLPVGSKVTVL